MGVPLPPRVARLCSIHVIISLAGLRKLVRYTESSLYRSGSLNRGSTVYEHRGAPVVQTLYNPCTNLRPFSLGGYRYVPSLNIKSYRVQGHPMDLFHKISVLLAIFCWLGNVEIMICPRKESVAG